mmetsp:Transcript_58808/g.144151  ORF Transcript_58808/g.144151 Transcript_58808/m.144151 type:complete len:436 (+) Transcript_58808:279-1586(+)
MKIYDDRKYKTNNLVSNNLISNIKGIENEQNYFAVICASKIVFISGKEEKIRRSIRSRENIFLNGSFKPLGGEIFAISGKNKKIELIDTDKNCLIRKIKAHKKSIYDLGFSHDKIRIITGSDDFSVKLWDITTQKCLSSFNYHRNFVRSVSFFPEHNSICGSSSFDGTIKIYDLRCHRPVVSTFNHSCPVEMFSFLPGGNKLMSIGGNQLKIWCALSKKKILTINEKKGITTSELYSADSILYCGLKGELKKYNFFKNQLSSVCFFRSNIISITSLSLGLMIGFSNGKICFKKYLKKNLNYNFFSEKYKDNILVQYKKKCIDSCSNFFYFPKQKKSFLIKKELNQKIKNKKKSERKKNLNFYLKRNSFEFMIKKKMFDIIFQNLLEVKNGRVLITIFEEFVKKKRAGKRFIYCQYRTFSLYSGYNYKRFLYDFLP